MSVAEVSGTWQPFAVVIGIVFGTLGALGAVFWIDAHFREWRRRRRLGVKK